MTSVRAPLGDSHNFGRRVARVGNRIAKPRTLFWEWLVLAADSPLRKFWQVQAELDGLGADAFAFLPALQFWHSAGGQAGEVEEIALSPLRAPGGDRRLELAGIVGRSLALWSWLGVSDLHWENLVLGVDARGNVVFTPLDVELIFADLSLPTETKLLPDADPEYAAICQHACGVRRVLPYLGKPLPAPELLQLAAAYRQGLAFLDRHSTTITELLRRLPGLRESPIRVCLRSTEEYVNAGRKRLWPPLLPAEAEQLARGDIPYFFRLYGRPGIHYWGDAELTQLQTLPAHGDVPQLDPLLQLSRGFRTPTRKKLREAGLFAVLGAFDHRSLNGQYVHPELEIAFRKRSIVVKLPSGDELESTRDLRAFVGSVYLPCSCGEVESVFVPPVTRCLAGSASTF
jgi:hypothetical protein